MPAIESRSESIWWAKQTVKGTPAAAPATNLAGGFGKKVGGDASVARTYGSENYSDGSRFGSARDFVNTVTGDGAPVVQGSPIANAYLTYLMNGAETVTGAADPWTHTSQPANAGSFWATVWKKLGNIVQMKQVYNDCRLSSLRYEASSASKVLHLTPTFISLDPGVIYTTDPAAADETEDPFLYTEAQGAITIDGSIYRGASSMAIQVNDTVSPWYGDAVTAYDVTYGVGSIAIEGITILVDAVGFAWYNTQVYGTASPTPGTKPVSTLPALGNFTIDMTRTGPPARECKLAIPGTRWNADVAIPGNPDGGPVELSLSGGARPVGGIYFTVTNKIGVAAFT